MKLKKRKNRTASRMMFASIASLSALTLGAGAARATTPTPILGLYNTGTNNDGSLAAAPSADPHYTLPVNLDSGTTAYVTSPGSNQFVNNGWGVNTITSQWISAQPIYTGNTSVDPSGNYTYQTTFSLNGFTPSTAVITGDYVLNNQMMEIDLNGVNTNNPGLAPGHGNTKSLEYFTINSGFINGTNTLDFVVYNAPGSTGSGLQIESLTGTAVDPPVVPEPASLGLMGLAIVGVLSRRRANRPSRLHAAA